MYEFLRLYYFFVSNQLPMRANSAMEAQQVLGKNRNGGSREKPETAV